MDWRLSRRNVKRGGGGSAIVPLAALLGGAVISPANAGDVIPPKIYTVTPGGINLSDGSFTYSKTDLVIGTLSLERFYLGSQIISIDPDTMFYGPHQSNNFDIFVTPVYTHIGTQTYARPIVHMGATASGQYVQHQFTGSIALTPDNLDANRANLELVNGAYKYTATDGTIFMFNPSVQPIGARAGTYAQYAQRIASIAYPDGRVRSFSYVNGNLKLVSDSTGYAIVFDYGADGLIGTACGFNLSQTYVSVATTCSGAALKVSYGYTSGKLTSFTDVLGQVETYGYVSGTAGLMNCIKPAGYAVCKIANWTGGHTQVMADGSTWDVSGGATSGRDTEEPINGDGLNEVIVTDPAGKNSFYSFTGTSPYVASDPLWRTTQYRYTGGKTLEDYQQPDTAFGSYLVSATMPEGDQYLAEYNGPYGSVTKETMVPKPGSGLASLIKEYGYSYANSRQAVAKPVWIKDPKGNQTDFTYAPWGGVLSEMQPAPSSGAARPLKLYTYVQKYAYVKNSGGSLVSTGVPIWVPSIVVQCQTAAGSSTAACDTAATAPRLQTTYQYGADSTADNLLLRGTEVKDLVTGDKRLTCFTYDALGRKISETSPRGTAALSISVCP